MALYAACVTFILNFAIGSGWTMRTYQVLLNSTIRQKDDHEPSKFSWKLEI